MGGGVKIKQVELYGVDDWSIQQHAGYDEPEDVSLKYRFNNKKMICWINDFDKVRVGSIVELVKVPGFWHVEKIFDIEQDHKEINRTWHVGGL